MLERIIELLRSMHNETQERSKRFDPRIFISGIITKLRRNSSLSTENDVMHDIMCALNRERLKDGVWGGSVEVLRHTNVRIIFSCKLYEGK